MGIMMRGRGRELSGGLFETDVQLLYIEYIHPIAVHCSGILDIMHDIASDAPSI